MKVVEPEPERRAGDEAVEQSRHLGDPNVLTLGFARRFTNLQTSHPAARRPRALQRFHFRGPAPTSGRCATTRSASFRATSLSPCRSKRGRSCGRTAAERRSSRTQTNSAASLGVEMDRLGRRRGSRALGVVLLVCYSGSCGSCVTSIRPAKSSDWRSAPARGTLMLAAAAHFAGKFEVTLRPF